MQKVDYNDDEKILYTPDNWEKEQKEGKDGVTGKYILDLCNGDLELAKLVYSLCDWQHPETILAELKNEGEVRETTKAIIHSRKNAPSVVVRLDADQMLFQTDKDGFYIRAASQFDKEEVIEGLDTLQKIEVDAVGIDEGIILLRAWAVKYTVKNTEIIQETVFLNRYHCSCGEKWEDRWSCACNDRCPSCNLEIEPLESIEE